MAEASASGTVDRSAAGPSTTPERVTVTTQGNVVDVADTGIDPTFLEAFPDDTREEVLNQHFRDQRSTQAEQVSESQISPKFLDALPPEIRAEILREERLERSRREGQAEGGVPPSGPAGMGAADFIASLDPQLRQVVLLDSDEGILQTLPSHMVAEAGAYRGGDHIRQRSPRPAGPPTTTVASPRKPPPSRDTIQLLERRGITTLVRLLFFPQLSRKTTLHKVLLNLCENSKSYTELFNVLLSILQDGIGDLALVDKSFSQLSVRTPRGPSTSPKASGKQKDPSLSTTSHIVPNKVPPELVAQRCLDALTFFTGANEHSSLFFLTEHELPVGLKKTASKKGKGKEKQAPQSHYPIVLPLGLLDRQSLLKTPAIMESTASLLDLVTRPLTGMKNVSKAVPIEEPVAQASGDQANVNTTIQGTTGKYPSIMHVQRLY
jgi:E3 ubiquitin-protein ligase HUWE1